MNEHVERDPLGALAAADPVDPDRLSSASLARIRARVSEDVMTSTTARRPARTRLLGLGVGAAAAALALILVVGRPAAAPGVVPGGSVGSVGSAGVGSASCVEPYSGPASIANRTLAFDGTVTAISGDKVTFAVNAAYRGAGDPTITLDAEGMTGTTITSAGGPNLAVGERYLVAGDDHFVWSCGYTQPYDAALAAQWQAAAGG
ncbi:MAG: hypothetical protein H0U58_02900 [Chloroflexi bacterium]|nr:hypothetical protein [Chloroflexota bacterium]